LKQTIGHSSPIGLVYQESLKKLNEYYTNLNTYAHSSIATICNPRFNVSVFQVVLPLSTNDRKRKKIRENIGNCFSMYLQRELAIQRAHRQRESLEAVIDKEDELSDADLYRRAPVVLKFRHRLSTYLVVVATLLQRNGID
jgi:hypothetical protein